MRDRENGLQPVPTIVLHTAALVHFVSESLFIERVTQQHLYILVRGFVAPVSTSQTAVGYQAYNRSME